MEYGVLPLEFQVLLWCPVQGGFDQRIRSASLFHLWPCHLAKGFICIAATTCLPHSVNPANTLLAPEPTDMFRGFEGSRATADLTRIKRKSVEGGKITMDRSASEDARWSREEAGWQPLNKKPRPLPSFEMESWLSKPSGTFCFCADTCWWNDYVFCRKERKWRLSARRYAVHVRQPRVSVRGILTPRMSLKV